MLEAKHITQVNFGNARKDWHFFLSKSYLSFVRFYVWQGDREAIWKPKLEVIPEKQGKQSS